MERIDALKQLAAKVEAGEWSHDDSIGCGNEIEILFGSALTGQMYRGWHAYHGSLDAAKALMEAVLPGWDVQIGTYDDETFEASVAPALEAKSYDRISHCMARAWLLAILRALISMEEAK